MTMNEEDEGRFYRRREALQLALQCAQVGESPEMTVQRAGAFLGFLEVSNQSADPQPTAMASAA